jgi:methionyl-tRNA formyltransferase
MTDTTRLRVVFAGTPDFAAVALHALIQTEHDVVAVLTQPDRPAGRGRSLTASPVKALATEHEIPVLQPVNFREPSSVDALRALNCDLMVVAAYGIILPQAVLDVPRHGCLNIHASLLPRWRGAAPIQRAILAGDTQSGVCIMHMDAGLDTGDVISESVVAIEPDTTGSELHDTLAEVGAQALLDVIAPWCAGEIKAVAQPEEGITYADKLNKAEAKLDFNEPAILLHRKIQAFNAWPVATCTLDDLQIRVWRSAIPDGVSLPADCQPGDVLATTPDYIRVATGDGVLDITELQKPGKKSLSAGEFNRGTDLSNKAFA